VHTLGMMSVPFTKGRCIVDVNPFPGQRCGYLTDGQDKGVLLFSPEI